MGRVVTLTVDTSALIAVIGNEASKDRIIEITANYSLYAPASVHWEIGNAFSAMFKQSKLKLEEAQKGLKIFESIPIQYIKPDFVNTMKISKQANIYAYDAYFLDCASRYKAPILTLDRKLRSVAQKIKVAIVEV